MKTLVIVVVAVVALLLNAGGAGAAEPMDGCAHDDVTIASLRACIEHAVAEGHIDDARVARSLLAMVDQAQAALDRGQPAPAVAILKALIREIDAQAGMHIVQEHAEHLVIHAEAVIVALQQSA